MSNQNFNMKICIILFMISIFLINSNCFEERLNSIQDKCQWDKTVFNQKYFNISGNYLTQLWGSYGSYVIPCLKPIKELNSTYTFQILNYETNKGSFRSVIQIGIMEERYRTTNVTSGIGIARYRTYPINYGDIQVGRDYTVPNSYRLYLAPNDSLTMNVNFDTMEITWQANNYYKQKVVTKLGDEFKNKVFYVFARTSNLRDSLKVV